MKPPLPTKTFCTICESFFSLLCAEQDRVQSAAEGARGVAAGSARWLQAQGLRQPPEVGHRGGWGGGDSLCWRDLPATSGLPWALPHGGSSGYISASGTNASTHLQQWAHLSRYNSCVPLLTLDNSDALSCLNTLPNILLIKINSCNFLTRCWKNIPCVFFVLRTLSFNVPSHKYPSAWSVVTCFSFMFLDGLFIKVLD